MRSNEELQAAVEESIKWEYLLNAAEIGVTAKDGIVTLTGVVDSFTKKYEAENAAKSVSGVKVVVEKIEVQIGRHDKATDNDIANEILNSFKYHSDIPEERIKVRVEDGWVTLEGDLEHYYHKDSAYKAVVHLFGVTGITNNLVIKSEVEDKIEKIEIESAIKRNWMVMDQHINIEVYGNRVTLSGSVDSLYQKNEAARIAWNAPGVVNVDNLLEVEYLMVV